MAPHILLVLSLITSVHSLCYFPNGDAARGDFPCRQTKDFSACCGRGYKCVSNGMCQSSEDQLEDPGATEFVRGSCDDQQWKSANCPNYCVENNPSGGAGIVKCQGYTNRFYCTGIGANASRCDDDQEHLSFPGDPFILTTVGLETTSTASTESTASTTEASTTEASTTEASSTEAESTTSTSSAAETETAAASSESSSGSDSKAAVIGGAVGGSVGGLLLGGLGVWLVLWLRKRKRAAAAAAAGTGEAELESTAGTAGTGTGAETIKPELPGEGTVSPVPSPPSELPGHFPDNQAVR
ncbi:hypothetical protein ACJZ2D_003216 [Fusarium nematophilum]